MKSKRTFSTRESEDNHHEFGKKLHQHAQQSRSRFCVVLCGDIEWGKESARAMSASYPPESVIHVTDDNHFAEHKTATLVGIEQTRYLLGREFDAVVYDGFSGFDADAVGILGGTVKAGGLFILIAPAIGQWAEFDDPQYARITAYDHAKPTFSHYIKRLANIIAKSPHCILVQQHHPLPQLANKHHHASASAPDFTDQNHAVAAIKRVISGQRRRPVVLLSDRGRGKSAALGIAAGQLLNGTLQRIGVTGFNKQSVACVFKHAALQCSQKTAPPESALRFIAADKLIETKADIDLLLVDEAASIPVAMLQKLLDMYSRIAFASTVHGYEGTGRGFVLRFQNLLDGHTRGWQSCPLRSPIRWAQDDALEQFLFDALLLNAEPQTTSTEYGADEIADEISLETREGISINQNFFVSARKSRTENRSVCGIHEDLSTRLTPQSRKKAVNRGTLDFNLIARATLSENEKLTRDLFGLLTQAHYRTRPADLRHLLDAENLNIFTLSQDTSQDTTILGVAVVATEGGFDEDIARKIWANQSRPKGHFLAELLCAQQGLIEAAKLQIARIMRIVVNPIFHRRGIGRQLLCCIADFYQGKVDLLGTTFGMSPAVLEFWLDSNYAPVRIGHSQSHNTGTHSCTLIKAVSTAGHALVNQATNKFSDNLSYQLNSTLSAIDPSLVPPIYRTLGKSNASLSPISDTDLVDLVGFAFANQNMENIPACLIRLVEQVLKSSVFSHDDPHMILLVERILLGKAWKACSTLPAPQGKKQGTTMLRNSVASSLVALYPAQVTRILKKFDVRPLHDSSFAF